MAQENRHLTTEQLSAYLDERWLSAEEQSQSESHLKTCEPCRQELADLRQTVALLHALPRPALPRSFVLPLDITSQSTDDHIADMAEDEAKEAEPVLVPMAAFAREAYVRAPESSSVRQVRRRPGYTYIRTALRTLSAVAAVIGLVLFLSGVLTSFGSGARNTASTMSQASSGSAQNANVASNEDNNKAASPQISPAAPTPKAEATANTAVKSVETPTSGQETFQATGPTRSQTPTILFFDLSTGPGRLGFGFLLLLLGVMGYVVFKRQWRQERA